MDISLFNLPHIFIFKVKVFKSLFFLVKSRKKLFHYKKQSYLCTRKSKKGFVAQLDRASDYGSEGLRFESLQGHTSFFQVF